MTNRKGYGHHGDHYGSLSGHGGYCEEDQVSIGLLVVALAGIGLMFYTLLTKVQANGGRKKREAETPDKFNTFWSLFETNGRFCFLKENINTGCLTSEIVFSKGQKC